MTPDGRSRPHVFVADLTALELSDSDRHHLSVLRVRLGDELTVSDGEGRFRVVRFGAELEPVSDVAVVARPTPPITVAFAPVKGDRPEWTVQKLTELGIDVIVPLVAERSVVVWPPDRVANQVERLRRISREAAMQSRQCWLPDVRPPVSFMDAAALEGACLAEPGGRPPSLAHPTVLIGPEGGWTPEERAAGLPAVGLGPTILRAETAALAAAVVLTGLRSGLLDGHV